MSTESTCARCQGPNDPLHTRQECNDLAGLGDLADGHRVTLALVAGLLAHATNPLAMAARLREMGVIQDAP